MIYTPGIFVSLIASYRTGLFPDKNEDRLSATMTGLYIDLIFSENIII